jgi:hypothetical protein
LDDLRLFKVATDYYPAGDFAEQKDFDRQSLGVKVNFRPDSLWKTAFRQGYGQTSLGAIVCRLDVVLQYQLADAFLERGFSF